MNHLELDEFTALMNTPCHELSDDDYLKMLECSVSASVVLMADLLKNFPKQSKERLQLDVSDLALME